MQFRRRVLSKRTKVFRILALTRIFARGEKGATDYGDCRSPIKVAPATWRWVEWREGIKPPTRRERMRGWLGEKRVDSDAKEWIESSVSSFSPSRPNRALPGDRNTVVVIDPQRYHAGRTQRERTFDLSRALPHLNRCAVVNPRHPRSQRIRILSFLFCARKNGACRLQIFLDRIRYLHFMFAK